MLALDLSGMICSGRGLIGQSHAADSFACGAQRLLKVWLERMDLRRAWRCWMDMRVHCVLVCSGWRVRRALRCVAWWGALLGSVDGPGGAREEDGEGDCGLGRGQVWAGQCSSALAQPGSLRALTKLPRVGALGLGQAISGLGYRCNRKRRAGA
jgi:hypothetical protein